MKRLRISQPVWVGAGVVLGVWWALRLAPDAFVTTVFCRVPAGLAAWYYNVALQTPELMFTVRGTLVEVIRPCGATDFFSMVAGLFAHDAAQASRPLPRLFFVPPLAWGVTIFANSVRIIFLVPLKAWLYHHPWFLERAHLDDHFGTFIFLTLFIFLWEGLRHVKRNIPATR